MPPPTRVYIGRLSMRTTARDIDDMFSRFGTITKLDMKNGFGFVEFEDERDAEDAIREMDGRDVDGNKIQVEHAKGPRPGGSARGPVGSRTDYRVRVENLSRETSWQDLKDFARGGGRLTPLYTEVTHGIGIIEYRSYDDMKDALRQLHDTELRGAYVKLYEDRGRSRSPPRDRSPRRSYPPPSGYRSRSPPGGGYRSRSPPRRRPEEYSPPRYRGGGGGGYGRSRSR